MNDDADNLVCFILEFCCSLPLHPRLEHNLECTTRLLNWRPTVDADFK